jgi:hypothetical protein
MKRKLVMLATAMMILVLAAPAWALKVDFTAGETGGSGLTITAKIMGGISASPFTTGQAASVYLGNLGDLGVTGQSYVGLGVGADSADGAITLKEALVFTFAQPQNSNQLVLTMLGLNAYAANGSLNFPADTLRIFYKVASGEVGSVDANANAINTFGPNYASMIRYGVQYGGTYADARVTAFAVEQVAGSATSIRKFGVGTLTYDYTPVPEPLTLLLLGAGLIGIAGIRRFGK